MIAVGCTYGWASVLHMYMHVCTCWRICLHAREGVACIQTGSDCTCMYIHVLTCLRLRAHKCAYCVGFIWLIYTHTQAGVIAYVSMKCGHDRADVHIVCA